jgi:hypothetical protein
MHMRRTNFTAETQCWIVCAIGASIIQFTAPSQSPTQASQNAVITMSIFASAALISQIRSENS